MAPTRGYGASTSRCTRSGTGRSQVQWLRVVVPGGRGFEARRSPLERACRSGPFSSRTERLRAHGINRQRSVIALAIGRPGNRSKPSRLRLEAALTPFATAHAMNAMVSRMASLVFVYGLELSFDALAEMLLQL